MTQLLSVTAGSRTCKTCQMAKPFSDYYKNSKSYFTDCKDCHNEKKRARYRRDPAKSKAQSIKHTYKLEPAVYLGLVQNTPYCPICGSQSPLVVDHDHSTSEVRGLICQPCNKGIGFFRDNVSSLKNAIAYLENGPLSKTTKPQT